MDSLVDGGTVHVGLTTLTNNGDGVDSDGWTTRIVRTVDPRRVHAVDRIISSVGVQIHSARDPDRIFREKPPDLRIVVARSVVIEPGFSIILPPGVPKPYNEPGVGRHLSPIARRILLHGLPVSQIGDAAHRAV